MSVGVDASKPRLDGLAVYSAVVLAGVALVAAFFGPFVALAVLALAVVQRVEPLGFLPAYWVVVAVAAFVDYWSGTLTRELTRLVAVAAFMLACWAIAQRRSGLGLPRTPLTLPLLLYALLMAVGFARGAVTGLSMRYAGLEILAALALGSALLVSTIAVREGRLYATLVALILTAFGNSSLGFYAVAAFRRRVGTTFFTPLPGVVAMLLFNVALREKRPGWRLLWSLAVVPLLLHQFMSFTRGYWFGVSGGLAFSVLLYLWIERGAATAWRRIGAVAGVVAVCFVVGLGLAALAYNMPDLLALAGQRFSSTTSTDTSLAAASNLVRLAEYASVIQQILQSPWIGHGLGYSFVVREPFFGELMEQWWSHQMYLYVWLKLGLPGLIVLVWMLVAAVRTGWIGAARFRDGIAAGWCAGAAAATVFVSIHGMVYFTLAEVNTVFPLALVWGIAMALVARGRWRLRWRADAPRAAGIARA